MEAFSPTMPRMSYSRRLVGSKLWRKLLKPGGSPVVLQEAAHAVGEIGPGQGEGQLRLEIAELVAAVEPRALVAQAVERGVADHPGHAVGELDLVAGATLAALEMADHLGQQDVAPDDREVGGGDRRIGLLDQAGDLDEAAVIGCRS